MSFDAHFPTIRNVAARTLFQINVMFQAIEGAIMLIFTWSKGTHA
jgi:hypothetical protein